MVESKGVGSIWNSNSWHWEEKNYNEFAKKYLKEKLVPIEVTKEAGKVKLYEVKDVRGTASISVRKQKQICLFEFEIEFYFEASRGEEEQCKGTIQVHEFNQDDDDVDITVTCEKPGEFVAGVKKVLVNDMKAPILAIV